jgi:hypothetical protein
MVRPQKAIFWKTSQKIAWNFNTEVVEISCWVLASTGDTMWKSSTVVAWLIFFGFNDKLSIFSIRGAW